MRDAVRKINSNLLIGMYPHPVEENFVQYLLAKGFSSQRLPFVVFGIHSCEYNIFLNGDACIPKDVKGRCQKEAINALYVAGYLLEKYDGAALERNLEESLKN